MCSDCRFAGAVTTGYKIRSAGEAVTPGYKIHSAGEVLTPGYKIHSAGEFVTPGYKIRSAGEAVTTGYKIHSAGEAVTTGHKTGSANFVPTGDKTASVGDDGNPVSTGYKTDDAGDEVNSVSTGYKTDDAGDEANPVSTGYKTDDAAAMTASAKCMDACAGAAWMLFAVTARDGMAWTVAGRGAFAVTGCFLLLPFGMRCAGYGYVVMNSFFACRDDFIFSQFVISFLPLKEPLRVRGDFSLLEVL